MAVNKLHPTHLDGWVGLSGVVAFLSRDAAGGSPLTLVPEPHPPLFWLLDDLYVGGRWLE